MASRKLAQSNLAKLPVGIHSDGDGLYLRVQKSGSKNWVFITKKLGKRAEIGLGGFGGTAPVGLALARRKAEEIRQQIAEGIDPRELRRKPKIITFKDCMDELLDAKSGDWTNETHRHQWHMTLNEYAKPLHDLSIADIIVGDVKSCLLPHWKERPETADRLRSRIQAVIDYGIAHEWRTAGNPAIWKGLLDKVMPSRDRPVKHHEAVPFADIPNVISNLRKSDSVGARLIEFITLTAVRFSEGAKANWSEFDFESNVWVIPAKRMKIKKDHRIPLTSRMVELLEMQQKVQTSDLLWEGSKAGAIISSTAASKALRRASGTKATIHGLRSTFKDWAAENTDFPNEISEHALAHAVGSKVEQAYRRGDAFEKRRELMNSWEMYLNG